MGVVLGAAPSRISYTDFESKWRHIQGTDSRSFPARLPQVLLELRGIKQRGRAQIFAQFFVRFPVADFARNDRFTVLNCGPRLEPIFDEFEVCIDGPEC